MIVGQATPASHPRTPVMDAALDAAEKTSGPKMSSMDIEVVAPPHYISPSGLEHVDVVEAFNLNHNRAAALKYLLRAGKKDPGDHAKEIQDLSKLVWHIEREKKRLKGELDVTWTSSPR